MSRSSGETLTREKFRQHLERIEMDKRQVCPLILTQTKTTFIGVFVSFQDARDEQEREERDGEPGRGGPSGSGHQVRLQYRTSFPGQFYKLCMYEFSVFLSLSFSAILAMGTSLRITLLTYSIVTDYIYKNKMEE